MILSGTRPVNRDGAEHAGDSAGQPLNRLFEGHSPPGREEVGDDLRHARPRAEAGQDPGSCAGQAWINHRMKAAGAVAITI
jgi:hypothetical protein